MIQALHERGEKLSELEERTAQMMANAENFSTGSHQLMQKYKDKKWYQFWCSHRNLGAFSMKIEEDLYIMVTFHPLSTTGNCVHV